MRCIVKELDTDDNNKISYKEFIQIMAKPDAYAALDDVGVSPTGIVDFAELFFVDDGQPVEMTFESFMEMILDLRETNTCTVKDMLKLWMNIKGSTNKELTLLKNQAKEIGATVNEKMKKFNVMQSGLETTVSSMLT